MLKIVVNITAPAQNNTNVQVNFMHYSECVSHIVNMHFP